MEISFPQRTHLCWLVDWLISSQHNTVHSSFPCNRTTSDRGLDKNKQNAKHSKDFFVSFMFHSLEPRLFSLPRLQTTRSAPEGELRLNLVIRYVLAGDSPCFTLLYFMISTKSEFTNLLFILITSHSSDWPRNRTAVYTLSLTADWFRSLQPWTRLTSRLPSISCVIVGRETNWIISTKHK